MKPILIAGAGPTGLTAALMLTEREVPVRIIDRADDFSAQSKALAVNPRTLDLLESTGVTEQLLSRGWRVQRMNMWRNRKRVFQLDMSRVKHRFNFMLVHPQSDSERVLAAALAERGVEVEHGVELTELRPMEHGIEVTLNINGSNVEEFNVERLLGADGAHSRVRKQLEVDFPGEAYAEHWKVYDVSLDVPLEPDEGHVFLLNDGVLFMLRVRDDLWRLAGNVPDLLSRLPAATDVGAITWESEFRISNRVAKQMQVGPICLAGDAAHIHSPLGARGMNLGVEDACVYARLAAEDRLAEYQQQRLPIVRSVVRWVGRTTEIPRGRTFLSRMVRTFPRLVGMLAPLGANRTSRWVMGLDHEI